MAERNQRWVPMRPVMSPSVGAPLNASAPPVDSDSESDDDSDYIDAGSSFQQQRQPQQQQQQQTGQDSYCSQLTSSKQMLKLSAAVYRASLLKSYVQIWYCILTL